MNALNILRKVVKAWEALPGNQSYSRIVVQSWLIKDMKPAIDKARAALAAQPVQEVNYGVVSIDRGFRWDSAAKAHVPQLVIEFEAVPGNSPNTEKGWVDRDAVAAMLASKQEKP
jgi:hypothetical protein